MKFSIVLGNPPYNKGIDMDFVFKAFELSDNYMVMITPAKCFTSEAKQQIASTMSYGDFREKIVPHISDLVFYPCCKDVFDILQVDGIVYYIVNKNTKFDKCNIKNICKHLPQFNSDNVSRNITNRQSLLNIGNEIIEYLGEYKRFTIPNTYFKKKYQVWTSIKAPGGNLSTVTFPRKTLFIGESTLEEYTGIEVKHSDSKICSFTSDSRYECESFISWLNCKFTRFFTAINQSKLTGIITDDCFRFVPAPPSGKFDHIYTDQELYKIFNLPQRYIDIIESIVKERQ